MNQRQLQFAVLAVSLTISGFSTAVVAETHPDAAPDEMAVRHIRDTGAFEIVQGDEPVLQYNYELVSPPPKFIEQVQENNRKYTAPRCDYIHPLYGPNGEILTDDWVVDHPHHRGIYWAWPEVYWQNQCGDLHALQQVFSRPTGKIDVKADANIAQITAENEWRWNDETPVVNERVVIRAHHRTEIGRAIDLSFRFSAINSDVQAARRAQSLYGGLNLRLAPVKQQEISLITDPVGATPRRAWAYRGGIPHGGQNTIGLTILQSQQNPDYPGDWIQYPDIYWVQPTFPRKDVRYTITKNQPLELQYRLWIHKGNPGPEKIRDLWMDYNTQ